jgi:AcrR family transcriptional regulator
MAEIARRSGVGPATLYRNFATRSLTRHSPDYTGAAPDVHAVRRTVRNPTLRRFAALTGSGCAVATRRSQPASTAAEIQWRPLPETGGAFLLSLVGEALDEDPGTREEFVHGGDRSPSCGTSAPAGVP